MLPAQPHDSHDRPPEPRTESPLPELSLYRPDHPGEIGQARPATTVRSSIIHDSVLMTALIEQAIEFAHCSATILVHGESGTGKEMLSRLIHEHSGRPSQSFVAVNCAAIPELLMESEFFGHCRGAFTGAVEQRIGHFEQAHGGTILLDEISEVPLSTQSKLLRVLEEREVQQVGSNQRRKIDIRVIATSNKNLKLEVQKGRFRLDLFHRINVLELRIPPLRERLDDLACLTSHFIQSFANDRNHELRGVTETAMTALQNHSWPGNIRELRNVIQRASILSKNSLITRSDLGTFDDLDSSHPTDLRGRKLVDVERTLILESLTRHRGDKHRVANELGITTRTLNNKLRKYREDGTLAGVESLSD